MRAPAEAGGLIGPHLQAFFAEHLLAHKRASPQTIACYRDTFRLLLRFMRERTGAEPAGLPLAALDADAVLAFLDHLERDRTMQPRSRNNRLAAIRSFFRLVALRVPDRLGQVTRVMAIPVKRGDKRLVSYLTRDEVKALLAAPDRTTWSGRRDHALLLTANSDEAGRSFQSEAGHPDGCSWVKLDGPVDRVGGQAGMVCGAVERRLRRLSPVSSMR